MRTSLRTLVIRLMMVGIASCNAAAQDERESVTIWLMPSENAGQPKAIPAAELPAKMRAFREEHLKNHVRILNLEGPLAMRTEGWNPQFNVPRFQIIASQVETLKTLAGFASDKSVTVAVRFITWDEAFTLLNSDQSTGLDVLPDLTQIGTSWAGYFEGKSMLDSFEPLDSSDLPLRDIGSTPAAALSFLNDVRVIFFWKGKNLDDPKDHPLRLENASWPALLKSFRDGTEPGDTLSLPVGFTLNLLHDYFPLALSGQASSVFKRNWFGYYVNLTDNQSTSIPDYLAENSTILLASGEQRRIVEFPESSHEESARAFIDGRYRAVIEPFAFLSRWYEDFETQQKARVGESKERRRFWDYAGVLVPPLTFHGGSDLVILRARRNPELARSLARFLSQDERFNTVLSASGHLPSGKRDRSGNRSYGIDELFKTMAASGVWGDFSEFRSQLLGVLKSPLTYPDLPYWPVAIESHDVQEGFQRVWRRLAGEDISRLRESQDALQTQINDRLFWPARAWRGVRDALPYLIPLIMIAGFLQYRSNRNAKQARRNTEQENRMTEQRIRNAEQKISLLIGFRQNARHGASSNRIWENLKNLHVEVKSQRLDAIQGMRRVDELAHIYFERFLRFDRQVEERFEREFKGNHESECLANILDYAWDGAAAHFQLCGGGDPQMQISLQLPSGILLSRWRSVLLLVMEEWFFNCLRYASPQPGVISVSLESSNVITVTSPGCLSDENLMNFAAKAGSGMSRKGIPLIRDLCFEAFGSKIDCTNELECITVSISLPLEDENDYLGD